MRILAHRAARANVSIKIPDQYLLQGLCANFPPNRYGRREDTVIRVILHAALRAHSAAGAHHYCIQELFICQPLSNDITLKQIGQLLFILYYTKKSIFPCSARMRALAQVCIDTRAQDRPKTFPTTPFPSKSDQIYDL